MSAAGSERTLLVEGAPPRLRSPDFWSIALSELMDALACLAIYLSGEVQPWPFAVAAGLTAVRWFLKLRFRPFWIGTGYLLLLFAAFQLFSRFEMHPIVAAAHAAPLALVWLSYSRGAAGLWGWRMGLGFVALLAASALSPEFSVMMLIVAFVVAGSIALSCRFIAQEFAHRGAIGTLPAGFIRTSLYQTGTLFLAALIIFPLIPRVQGRGGFGSNDPAKTGYTEEVNLSEWSRVSNRGSSAIALRIYGPDGADPASFIPAGLLRSRILSVLADNRWEAGPTKVDGMIANGGAAIPERLTIVREMTGPAFLPSPYGARDVSIDIYGYRYRSERTARGEWREGRYRNQRFNYSVGFDVEPKLQPQDRPTSLELSVPPAYRTERLQALAARLFAGKKTLQQKTAAVHGHFIRENFRAVSAEDESGETAPPPGNLTPIERFLFVEKSGHCELFASSMAILLRLGGAPSRLVAGFRVSRDAVGDVLTVRQSDAHAWVEAYDPARGWSVFDPTPKLLRTLAITDWLRDSYDWASAKWTQYILNYGLGDLTLRERWQALKNIATQIASGKNPLESGDTETNLYLFGALFLMGAVGFSFAAIFVMRRLRRRSPVFRLDGIRRELARERGRIERLRRKIATAEPTPERFELFAATEAWLTRYESARFGAPAGDRAAWIAQARALRRDRGDLESRARRVA